MIVLVFHGYFRVLTEKGKLAIYTYGTMTALKLLSFFGVVIVIHIVTNVLNGINKESLNEYDMDSMNATERQEAMQRANNIDVAVTNMFIGYNGILCDRFLNTVFVFLLSWVGFCQAYSP